MQPSTARLTALHEGATMNRGWWRFYRKMLSDPLWEAGRKRTKFEAWIDLVSRAKGRPGRELVGYSRISLERGQLIFSIKGLAESWKWSRGKVRRFLSYLEDENQISVNRGCSEGDSKPDTKTNIPFGVITITNYERYNPLYQKTDTQTDTKRTPSGHPTDTSNKGIKKEGTNGAEHLPKYPTILTILHGIEGWPAGPKKDNSLIHRNKEKHDLTIDQLEQAAIELATWYDDNPGKIGEPKANPRMRFNTFARNRARWDRESGVASDDGQPHSIVTVGHIMEEVTWACLRAGNGEMDFEQFGAAILKRYENQTVNPVTIKEAWDRATVEIGRDDGR